MAHSDPKAMAILCDLLVQEARREFAIPVGEPCAGCGSTTRLCEPECPECDDAPSDRPDHEAGS